MKQLKDFLHLYLGCYGLLPDGTRIYIDGVFWKDANCYAKYLIQDSNSALNGVDSAYMANNLKLILRPLSDMTGEEADYFAWMCMDSRHHLDEDTRITQEEIQTELIKNDDGNLLDDNVEIYIDVSVRCFEGAVVIKKDGSISVYNVDADKYESIDDTAFKIHYLLSKHFDLFDLIPSGLAIDKTKL